MLAVDAAGLQVALGGRPVLHDLDLTVRPGTVHGLLGPNGAGKTTLLRVLFGLVAPQAGTLSVLGRGLGDSERLRGVGGFVESPHAWPYLSVGDNLRMLADLDGDPDAAGRVSRAMEEVGLTDRARERAGRLSTGLRQRLGVAAALLRDPALLVLDEPVTGLDPARARDLRLLVRRLAGSGRTVLLSSHLMSEVEQLCDDVTVLAAGRVVYAGGLVELAGRAPVPVWEVRTSDDTAAAEGALRIDRVAHGLQVHGDQPALDAWVLALAARGIAVRGLAPVGSPLETAYLDMTSLDLTA